MGDRVRITDVSPRDGLQNEPRAIATDRKIELIRLLCAAHVDEIEVSSFVSAKWVPQLADAADVFRAAATFKPGDVEFSALTPNERGVEAALEINREAGRRVIDKIAVFAAASETFSRKNTNATIAETIERFRPALALARSGGLQTRGYISCVVQCPFEGPIAPSAVARVAVMLAELGVGEIDLGETIGVASADTIRGMLSAVRDAIGLRAFEKATLHLHDTSGLAASCVPVALELGIRSFDGSAGGLGGCPYASTPQRRAPGNIATGALVAAINGAGYSTRVQAQALRNAAEFAMKIVADAGSENGQRAASPPCE